MLKIALLLRCVFKIQGSSTCGLWLPFWYHPQLVCLPDLVPPKALDGSGAAEVRTYVPTCGASEVNAGREAVTTSHEVYHFPVAVCLMSACPTCSELLKLLLEERRVYLTEEL